MLTLQRQDQTEPLNVWLRKLAIPRLCSVRGNETLFFEKAELRWGEVTKLTLQPFKYLPDAVKRQLLLRIGRPNRPLLLPRKDETRGKKGELELSDLYLNAVTQFKR